MEPHYLQINPNSFVSFDYKPKRYLTSFIKLANTSPQTVIFQIKTNAPFSYLVKPRLGVMGPNQSVSVTITMQPSDYDPHTTALNDKFLLTVCPIRLLSHNISIKNQHIAEIIKNTPQSLIQTAKLKVHLQAEILETYENSLDTRDTSGCEGSPVKNEDLAQDIRLEEVSTLRLLESLDRQVSDSGNLDTSFQGTLEMSEEKIKSEYRLITKCQSATEIPLKSLQQRVQLFEKQTSSVESEKRTQISQLLKMEEQNKLYTKALEERDKLMEHLEKIKENVGKSKIVCKVIDFGKHKGEFHFLYGFIIIAIGVLLGIIFKFHRREERI